MRSKLDRLTSSRLHLTLLLRILRIFKAPARNVDYLAMDSAQYYAVNKGISPCRDSKTACLNPSPQLFLWSMMNCPSQCCVKPYFSRQAFRSSLPTAVQRPLKSAHSTREPSISCSQTSSFP